MKRIFRFGIITKITIVLLFYISSIIIMGLISYIDLVATENKIKILEFSYGIHNNVLE